MGGLPFPGSTSSPYVPADGRRPRVGPECLEVEGARFDDSSRLGHDVSDWRLRLFPPDRRDWGEAYLTDFDTGSGLTRVVAYAWYLTVRRNPVTTVVIATSLAVVAIGTHLTWLALLQGRPPVVTLFAFTLVLQGSYTLVYMTGGLSALEPMASGALFAGESAVLMASLSGFGSTLFEYVRWIDEAPVGPMPVRALVAAQAVFTVYHYAGWQRVTFPRKEAAGESTVLVMDRDGRDGSRSLTESLAATGILLLGLLVVALMVTPRLRAMPWMVLLVVVVPYAVAGFAMVSRNKSSDLSTNVVRALAYIAMPALAVFFVFWRDLGDLRQTVLPGVLILTSGVITGAGLLTLHDRRSDEDRVDRRLVSHHDLGGCWE